MWRRGNFILVSATLLIAVFKAKYYIIYSHYRLVVCNVLGFGTLRSDVIFTLTVGCVNN